MLDDPATVDNLMARMRQQLPIPAMPSKQLVRTLREQGIKIKAERVLFIKSIHYLGDAGGISCDVTPATLSKEPVVVSLTHLGIPANHPLSATINAYQRERVRRIGTEVRW